MDNDNVIAFTEAYDKDGSLVRVDTISVGDGKIEEKKYIDGVDAGDKEAMAEAKAEKEAIQAKVDAINAAAEAEDGPDNQEGNPMTDTSNNYDIPEPIEKTEQQLHDEQVTAGDAAGPANAGTSTGEWVDAKQDAGELPSDEDANAARDDGPGATGEPAVAADAQPADPALDNEPKKSSRAKKTS